MLQAIRDRAQGWIAYVIVALIALPFMLWGVNSYFNFGPQDAVAKVSYPKDAWFGATELEVNTREYGLFLQSQKVDRNDYANPQWVKQVEDRLLIDAAATHAGMQIGDNLLKQEIRRNFTEEGKFRAASYQDARARYGTPRWNVDRLIEFNLRNQLVRSAILASAFNTKQELNQQLQLNNQVRDFGYAVVEKKRFLDAIQLTDEDISGYYEKHKQRFKTPEKLTLAYVELDVQKIISDIPDPDEVQLKSRYEDYKLTVQVPEQRRVSHILVKIGDGEDADKQAKAKIDAVYKQLQDGKAFTELAKQYSQDPSGKKGGDLGYVSADSNMLGETLKSALFALSLNGYSKPLKTPFGYQIVQLTELKKGEVPTFENVKDQLAGDYKKEKADDEMDYKREQIARKAFEDRSNLKGVAEKFSLQLKTEGPFDRTKPTGVAALPAVRELLQDPKIIDGVNSDPVEAGQGKWLFVRVDNRELPKQKTLEQVKDDIINTLKDTKAQDKAKALAEVMLEKIKKGEKPEEVTKAENSQWQSHEKVKRDDGKINFSIRRKIFQLPKPAEDKPAFEVISMFNGDYAVAALYKVEEGSTEGVEKSILDTTKRQLEFGWMMSEWQMFVNGIRQQAILESHPDRL